MTKSNLHHFLKALVTGHYVKAHLDLFVVYVQWVWYNHNSWKNLFFTRSKKIIRIGNSIMTCSPYSHRDDLFGFPCCKTTWPSSICHFWTHEIPCHFIHFLTCLAMVISILWWPRDCRRQWSWSMFTSVSISWALGFGMTWVYFDSQYKFFFFSCKSNIITPTPTYQILLVQIAWTTNSQYIVE